MRKKEGAFFMEPKIKMGISVVQNGLRAVSLGRKAFGIFGNFLPGRQKESGRRGNAEGGKEGGAGKYKDPPQEGQAEGTTAHQGHRACGIWWCEENISDEKSMVRRNAKMDEMEKNELEKMRNWSRKKQRRTKRSRHRRKHL